MGGRQDFQGRHCRGGPSGANDILGRGRKTASTFARRLNLLDENTPLDQRDLLRAWGIQCRIIGQDIARSSIDDASILALLPRLKQPTLFTRDEDFFKRELCHARYGLIWLDVEPEEAAMFIRRLLRHPRFRTKLSRLGVVGRIHHDGIAFWQRHRTSLLRIAWTP